MKKYILILAAALMTTGAMAKKVVEPNTMLLDYKADSLGAKYTLIEHAPSYQFVGANKDSIQAYKNGVAYGAPVAALDVEALRYMFAEQTNFWLYRASEDSIVASNFTIDEEYVQAAHATIAQDDFTYTKVDTAKAVVTFSANFPESKEDMQVSYLRADGRGVTHAVYPGSYAAKLVYDTIAAVDSFTIAKAPATVTALNAEKVYGDFDPENFLMDTVGVIEGDWVSLEIAREAGEAVGTYAINAKLSEHIDVAPARAPMGKGYVNDYYDWTFVPGTFTINPMMLAEAADGESEYFAVSAAGYCQGDEAGVEYEIEAGNPVAYSVTFSAEAKAQGFQDIAKTEMPAGNIKSFDLVIPANCHYGKYSADVYFYPALDIDSIKVPVNFTVNIPVVDIKQLFEDVVAIDNNEGKYTSYQWYHDGELIPGANLQYYQEKGGLTGTYYVEVTVEGLDYDARSCEEEYAGGPKAPAVRKVLRSNEVVIITPENHEYNVKGQVIK